MKKCASCTKDLPDAALHCVFCGAKQPPAPAGAQALAKTAFGYPAHPGPPGHGPAGAPPSGPPRLPPIAGAPPPPAIPYAAGPQPGAPLPQTGLAPASSAAAATMFAPGNQPLPPVPSYGQPSSPAMLATLVPTPQAPPMPQARPMAMPAPPMPPPLAPPPPPIMAIPAPQPPPYLAARTATRAARPIDPWNHSLRLMMFLWGAALLIAFATPIATAPELRFNWQLILEGEGTARLPPLMIVAVGFLSVVIAAIPMPSGARGAIALVLGLSGLVVPIVLAGVPAWLPLVSLIGTLLLVPGLLVRGEYRDAGLPRLLVTLGAIGVLLPYLFPQGGVIPLVSVFKGLIELPGAAKVVPALQLGLVAIVAMSLLAWLPAPASGAATLWAWLLILWSLVGHVATLLLAGNLGDAITGAPHAALVPWIYGGGSPAGVAIGAAYLALIGYGLAAVLGKQLE